MRLGTFVNNIDQNAALAFEIHFFVSLTLTNIWVKVFKNGLSKICGRQPLKNLKCYDLPRQTYITSTF